MKKLIAILSLLILVGCSGNLGEDDLSHSWYKGITDAEIPGKCLDDRGDVCALFDCLVNLCWCDDSSPDLPILYEKEGISLSTTEEAVNYVQKYVDDNTLGYSVKRAVKLNNIFFNVFAEDETGDEVVYTLAVDGTILKTFCGDPI